MIELYAKNTNLANVVGFIARYGKSFCEVEEREGVRADAVCAQSALETGWAIHLLMVRENGNLVCSNNFFNVKVSPSWKGRFGTAYVDEWINGKRVWMDQDFRIFDSIADSLLDYIGLIKNNTRYAKAWEVRADARKYAVELQRAGYATAPDYAEKIIKICETLVGRREA